MNMIASLSYLSKIWGALHSPPPDPLATIDLNLRFEGMSLRYRSWSRGGRADIWVGPYDLNEGAHLCVRPNFMSPCAGLCRGERRQPAPRPPGNDRFESAFRRAVSTLQVLIMGVGCPSRS